MACDSGRYDKALTGDFLAQPRRFVKGRVVAQRGVADARELVGQGLRPRLKSNRYKFTNASFR